MPWKICLPAWRYDVLGLDSGEHPSGRPGRLAGVSYLHGVSVYISGVIIAA